MPRSFPSVVFIMALLMAPAAEGAIYVSSAADGSAAYTDAPTTREFRPVRAFGLPPSADLVRGQYAQMIDQIAWEHAVHPDLVRAIIRVESNFEPLAVSRKGAQGLMQLMPATAGRFAVGNPFDPAENIRGGVQYLRTLLDQFPGQLGLALAAYNAGENAVFRFRGIPPYPETREYVSRVLGQFQRREASSADSTPPAGAEAARAAPSPRPAIYRSVDADGTPRYSNLPPLVRSTAR